MAGVGVSSPDSAPSVAPEGGKPAGPAKPLERPPANRAQVDTGNSAEAAAASGNPAVVGAMVDRLAAAAPNPATRPNVTVVGSPDTAESLAADLRVLEARAKDPNLSPADKAKLDGQINAITLQREDLMKPPTALNQTEPGAAAGQPEESPLTLAQARKQAKSALEREWKERHDQVEQRIIAERQATLTAQYTRQLQENGVAVGPRGRITREDQIPALVRSDIGWFTRGNHDTRGQINPWGNAIETEIDHLTNARFGEEYGGKIWVGEQRRKDGEIVPAHTDITTAEIEARARLSHPDLFPVETPDVHTQPPSQPPETRPAVTTAQTTWKEGPAPAAENATKTPAGTEAADTAAKPPETPTKDPVEAEKARIEKETAELKTRLKLERDPSAAELVAYGIMPPTTVESYTSADTYANVSYADKLDYADANVMAITMRLGALEDAGQDPAILTAVKQLQKTRADWVQYRVRAEIDQYKATKVDPRTNHSLNVLDRFAHARKERNALTDETIKDNMKWKIKRLFRRESAKVTDDPLELADAIAKRAEWQKYMHELGWKRRGKLLVNFLLELAAILFGQAGNVLNEVKDEAQATRAA